MLRVPGFGFQDKGTGIEGLVSGIRVRWFEVKVMRWRQGGIVECRGEVRVLSSRFWVPWYITTPSSGCLGPVSEF